MMSEHLRPIDGNGHVPAEPYGQLLRFADRFLELGRCPGCGLISTHSPACAAGLAIKDASALLEAAEVISRRWPGQADTVLAALLTRAEELSREIA